MIYGETIWYKNEKGQWKFGKVIPVFINSVFNVGLSETLKAVAKNLGLSYKLLQDHYNVSDFQRDSYLACYTEPLYARPFQHSMGTIIDALREKEYGTEYWKLKVVGKTNYRLFQSWYGGNKNPDAEQATACLLPAGVASFNAYLQQKAQAKFRASVIGSIQGGDFLNTGMHILIGFNSVLYAYNEVRLTATITCPPAVKADFEQFKHYFKVQLAEQFGIDWKLVIIVGESVAKQPEYHLDLFLADLGTNYIDSPADGLVPGKRQLLVNDLTPVLKLSDEQIRELYEIHKSARKRLGDELIEERLKLNFKFYREVLQEKQQLNDRIAAELQAKGFQIIRAPFCLVLPEYTAYSQKHRTLDLTDSLLIYCFQPLVFYNAKEKLRQVLSLDVPESYGVKMKLFFDDIKSQINENLKKNILILCYLPHVADKLIIRKGGLHCFANEILENVEIPPLDVEEGLRRGLKFKLNVPLP